MSNLTDKYLCALTYYAIGVSSEGGDVAYELSFSGNISYNKNGLPLLKPIGNSGYTIGVLQTDFGSHPKDALALVNNFDEWAKLEKPDWALTSQRKVQFSIDLGRDGNHIRDSNFDSDKAKYGSKKAIPSELMPPFGLDIDQNFKAHLKEYLATNLGKSFIHKKDKTQAEKIIRNVSHILNHSEFYRKSL